MASCSSAPTKNGYFDESGHTLSQQNQILARLNELFSSGCPQTIHITRNAQRRSQFHSHTSTIELGTDATGPNEPLVLKHESTHLCMAQITHGASTTDQYRFYDEGFATIVGGDFSPDFRKRALSKAASKALKGEVSFASVQNWSKYFGEPPKANYDAYDVGASFIFFVEDAYGSEKLFKFFRATGTEPNLDTACKIAFGENSEDIEQKWLTYLRAN